MRMRPLSILLLALATTGLSLPQADARPGGGYSVGSRGSHTYAAPPPTRTAPSYARPMDRSMAPRAPSNYGQTAPYAGGIQRPYGSYPQRHPFMTGFAGGLLGAGLFGMLSGHGFLGGMDGITSLFGFLIQVAIIGGIIVWLLRRFGGAASRGPSVMSRSGGTPFSGNGNNNVVITPDDYRAFQRLLLDIQAAWSAQNMRALSAMATPEMVSYFNEQLSDYASRSARNITSDVQFIQGDLSEAWREGNLTYATVAMRYSLIDVTTDAMGNVIDGSSTERQTVTELWTFVRADGRGNWVLSAIQQAG
ncbi:Tim44 domain-containing protein [Kozakia baliensis]|uniref:Tim44 domain-containing protein n=1 Tax=Kozakia baliensis TaxID=153496 RepID=UPI0004960D35|nr:TIM44-like domain-containing protein [Kozakia baliensis]